MQRLHVPLVSSLLLTVVAVLTGAVTTRADVIFFKDGFTLEGKTIREGTAVFESGQAIWMPHGAFFVDDFARRVYFSPAQIQEPTAQPYDPGKAYSPTVQRTYYPPSVNYLGSVNEVSAMEPWNEKWQRKVTLTPASGKLLTLTQQLTYLDPRVFITWTRSNSNYKWKACYLTSDLAPQEVVALLRSSPNLKDDAKLAVKERAERHFKIYQFLAQARLFELAAKELDTVVKDLPDEKPAAEKLRAELKQIRAQDTFDAIKRAQAAGQHEQVFKLLSTFPEEGLEEKLLTDVRDLRGKYEIARDNVQFARQLLVDLQGRIDNPFRKLFVGAAATIAAEVDVEDFLPPLRERDKPNVGRLELFLSLGRKYVAEYKEGKKPATKPDELLSLAMTGWLLGNSAAQTKVPAARKVWEARELAVAYLKSTEPVDRRQMIEGYLKGGSQVTPVEDFVQLIAHLPPLDAAAQPTTQAEERATEDDRHRKGADYLVKLPPEYRHNRPTGYPVLIALHNCGGKPRDMIESWSAEAARNGYILVAPKWTQNSRVYDYAVDEHMAVLDALRDIKRHFAVDSDRVFLFGYGQAGNAAFDIGLSHPDLFAGVIPMSGRPQYYVNRYAGNVQFLPFYIIGGDFAGDTVGDIRELINKDWLTTSYPVLYSAYQGRGLEWFPGELPIAMDWMNRKVRVMPLQGLGRTGPQTGGFSTMRPTDNHFYWLSTDSISKHNLNPGPKWNPNIYAATLQAIVSERNHINVNTSGIHQVTVWFGRGGLIDFDKPLAIFINLKAYSLQVKPSLETLLEDVRERGDRQQPFVAKAEFKVE